jgi:hypothetical protein
MYLASAGWALALGVALEVLWHARPAPRMRQLGIVLAGAVLVSYGVGLRAEVRTWETRAAVSRRAVADIEREALAAPAGTLIIAGAPRRSWDFALPHALRPPFTHEDLTRRVSVISHSSLHCCPAFLWEDYTRGALRTWISHPEHPPVIALYWNPATGELSRLSDRDDPFLRTATSVLLQTDGVPALDRGIVDIVTELVARRAP